MGTEQRRMRIHRLPERGNRQCYRGFRFEQGLVMGSRRNPLNPAVQPDPRDRVDNRVFISSVFSLKKREYTNSSAFFISCSTEIPPRALLTEIILQIKNCLTVTVESLALDCFYAGHAGIGDFAERLPGIHIGNMNFNSGNRHGL